MTDVHVVESQFAPDPDFPTVAFPNPEEPGATDALLTLAADVDADIAIALDPDADRCAVGVPTPGRLAHADRRRNRLAAGRLHPVPARPGDGERSHRGGQHGGVVAHAGAIAAAHGARHVETLTGFKWLARADADLPGCTLVYAYEEAIGHCVDPAAVRDKDGISAAVLACDLVVALRERGPHGARRARRPRPPPRRAHHGRGVAPVVDADEAAEVMARLRAEPPTTLCGFAVTMTDLAATSRGNAAPMR